MLDRISAAVDLGYVKFFRARLLILNSEDIDGLVDRMDKEVADIRAEALRMVWYMRGGLTYETAMLLGIAERKIIGDIIKENMETTKKSGLPFF